MPGKKNPTNKIHLRDNLTISVAVCNRRAGKLSSIRPVDVTCGNCLSIIKRRMKTGGHVYV